MAIFTSPTSLRNNVYALNHPTELNTHLLSHPTASYLVAPANTNNGHPSFMNLVLLVFEAVLEVICVSLPGYIAARQGMFDADAQKLVANLNVLLFTPCLGM